ncbi:universal stress protein [Streptomyces katrae]|uniref:universal stress protein n=1 Tax=Streptomyces katrae TaxID=68223 RepID=UPI0004C15FA5|nr:universal stress protein [Streptomyces katrae]
MGDDRRAPRVVVGVDGSPDSYGALSWAVRHASLIGAGVEAIAAYDLPLEMGWSAPAVDADFDEAETRRALTEEIRRVVGSDSPVPLEQHVVRGNPADVLTAAAEGAELLVVGSRGRGGFARLLLGSVSQQCALHAPCPVVIVRPRPASAADRS